MRRIKGAIKASRTDLERPDFDGKEDMMGKIMGAFKKKEE